jgi:NAD(P)-dependent dehydrogenase (short-subunit alcohol dehydrogenase family)
MKVLITGTSSGIGFGLSLHYLQAGHEVYGISRKINNELNTYAKFNFKSLDLSQFEEIETTFTAWIKPVGKFDLVILNAGILPVIADMKDTTLESIYKVMDVNVWANKLLLDELFKQTDVDQVIAISSGAAVSGSRGWNAYSLSKATLNMLINLYAKEQENTHFIALAPGIIDTNMQEYISDLPEEKTFPVIEKLKKAKGTPNMPDPVKAAPNLIEGIEKAKQYPSGDFVDIRNMS